MIERRVLWSAVQEPQSWIEVLLVHKLSFMTVWLCYDYPKGAPRPGLRASASLGRIKLR